METLFAVFVNNLALDGEGEPTNEKFAERRAAAYLYEYVTGTLPDGELEISSDESALY